MCCSLQQYFTLSLSEILSYEVTLVKFFVMKYLVSIGNHMISSLFGLNKHE